MIEAPTLETERLVLRAYTLEDFDAMYALKSNPAVMKYIAKPRTREETFATLLRCIGHWQLLGLGFWAIEEKQSGTLIGEAGFLDLRRDIEPTLDGTIECGWSLQPNAQGKNYAREAMNAAFVWAQKSGIDRPYSAIIEDENIPSVKFAKSLGFTFSHMAQYQQETLPIFIKET